MDPDVVAIDDLRKTYGGTVAVAGLSLRVRRGEVFGVLDPNGAGKTTTVECVAGLRRPDSGTVRVLGFDPATDPDEVRHRVGIQLQQAALPNRMTVKEAMAVFTSAYRRHTDPAHQPRDRPLAVDLRGDGEDTPRARVRQARRRRPDRCGDGGPGTRPAETLNQLRERAVRPVRSYEATVRAIRATGPSPPSSDGGPVIPRCGLPSGPPTRPHDDNASDRTPAAYRSKVGSSPPMVGAARRAARPGRARAGRGRRSRARHAAGP